VAERRFLVVWAEAAVRDLEEIATRIALDSPPNAAGVLERLERKAAALEVAPLRGHVVPELQRFGIGTFRELPARPHRIFYRVTGRTVHVLAVLDGRRELADVLLDRLIREP
jgi:toxin ParE1/3/4